MAGKRSAPPPSPKPELNVSREEARRRIEERIEKGRSIAAAERRDFSEMAAMRGEYETWDDYNRELLLRLFTTSKFADEYSWWAGISIAPPPPSSPQEVADIRRRIAEKSRRLESIRDRLELIPLSATTPGSSTDHARSHTNRVFVVHGHDEAAREMVARFLERLGVEAIILHEQVTGGRTLIEKLEHYADVDFAVVLLTPDDVGAAKTNADNLQSRARQNVVLELGYFVGKLGRTKVCALYRGPIELPSDYVGVGYVQLDAGGGWRLELAKELRAASFAVDMNLAV